MIKTDIRLPLGYSTEDIKLALSNHLPIERCEISDTVILKRMLDVSDRSAPHYRLTVGVSLSEDRERGLLKMKKKVSPSEDYTFYMPPSRLTERPVVVGAGPSGLFAALVLAEAGARPILLERGLDVESRKAKVNNFYKMGILDTECNVQFGEGGAGTYSDGKLKVGGMDKYKMKVLREFVRAGAPEEIIYTVGAHLGTDKLTDIVRNIREKLISLGSRVIFGAKFTEAILKDGRVVGVRYEHHGESHTLGTDTLILAIGHSARDTLSYLYSIGVPMQAKGFGIGVRIEHPREYINELVYGKNYDSRLESASYHLVTHLSNGRSVYSFCMCPGGTVVPAASEEGGIVTNGMSEYMRDGENSNAALLVSLTPEDFGSEHPLMGFEIQRRIESRAFMLAGSDYRAPAMTLGELLSGNKTERGGVKPSYARGTVELSVREYMPEFISDSICAAIPDFDRWMPGYNYSDAVLTGPETRSTSPVRILRTATFEAEGIEGLYPIGEGAGYAGGIVSSALDGVRCAESILLK